MTLSHKLTTLLFAGVALTSGTLQAQTILWGAGSTDMTEDSIGTFTSIDNTLTGAGWSGTATPAGANWVWSPDGVGHGARAPYWNTQGIGQWITSPTINTGCGFMDSDYYDNAGGASGTGPIPGPHNSIMVSPAIDLTGYTDSLIAVKFYVSYVEFQVTDMSVGFSTNGGASYTDVDYRAVTGGAGVRAWYNGWASITIPNILDGVTNLTDCRIRFVFNGDYYFTAIDDVSIITGDQYDIAFASPLESNEYKTISPVSAYTVMPMTVANNFPSYIYGAKITNNGGETIPLNANPRVTYEIAKEVTQGNWQVLTSQTFQLPAIAPGDTTSVTGDISGTVAALHDANGTGNYRITYTLAHDNTDGNTANNTKYWDYQLTGEWYSPCPQDQFGGPLANGTAYPGVGANNVAQEYEWGSFYYFPDTVGIALDSAQYRVFVSATHDINAVPFVEVTVNVYEAVDGNSDGQIDFDTEFQLRTLSIDTVVVTPSMLGQHILRQVKIVDPNNFNPLTFSYDLPYGLWMGQEADGLYVVTTSQRNSNGIITTGNQYNGFVISTCELPYEWHDDYTLFASTPLRVAEGLPGQSATSTWYGGFTGANSAPSMALKIIDNMHTNVQQTAAKTPQGTVNLFPNPAATAINISVDLQAVSAKVSYIVTDMQGRVINMQTRNNIQNDVFTMDVTPLAAGIYSVHVKTAEGVFTKRFVKE